MTPLPMTVISGYLGAGKTTLINALLAQDHGLKLLILVNDFGAINVDADLLASADEDTIALTNGCVCCTMGADLFMALSDALDRTPRPDHLIVEASGVADPAQIARAAIAEPDMTYVGIVTVIDGPAFADLRDDPLIGRQVIQQVACADLVWVSKHSGNTPLPDLDGITDAPVMEGEGAETLLHLLTTEPRAAHPNVGPVPHPRYVSWSFEGVVESSTDALREALLARPKGLFRVKGTVHGHDGAGWDVQVVGAQVSVRPCRDPGSRAIVGIGLAARVTSDEINAWWAKVGKRA